MSLDSLLERFVAAQERQALALETIAGSFEPKRPVGRPKKVETVEPAVQGEVAATPAPAPTSPPALTVVPTSPALADAKPAAEMPTVQPTAASPTLDLKEFQTLVSAACGKGFAPKVMELFKKHGGDRASTVPEANRAAAAAEIQALVAA